jgi:tRNA threonylcarbamoyladenosine biosynthesis protein TsaE
LDIQFTSHSPEETQSIGRILGEYSAAGDVILLIGELGAGKTCLTQGILNGLGSTELARSPTFVLIAEHEGRIPLYHMDLYRVGAVAQAEDLGIDEYLEGDGLTVVEWADNVPGLFSDEALKIRLDSVSESERRLMFADPSNKFTGVLEVIQRLGRSE